jgi:phospholipase/carboxylesterase
LIWLHGLGDSAYGFADIFLDPNWRFVPDNLCKVKLLTAPERPVTLNGGMLMNSWYDILSLRGDHISSLDDLFSKYSKTELMQSVDIVSKVIDQEVKEVGDPSKVWVGGFSQGCALSIATMLSYPKAFGGLVCLSGMNALKVDWKNIQDLENKKKMPVFMYHGESDDMIKHTIAK